MLGGAVAGFVYEYVFEAPEEAHEEAPAEAQQHGGLPGEAGFPTLVAPLGALRCTSLRGRGSSAAPLTLTSTSTTSAYPLAPMPCR